MQHILFRFSILAFVAFTFIRCQDEKERFLHLENPIHKMMVEEPVIIKRTELEQSWGKIPVGKVPLFVTANGDTVLSQVDDLDGDGQWDELLVLATMPPMRKHTLSAVLVDADQFPLMHYRTNIRLAGIENDQYSEMTQARRLSVSEGQAAGVYQMEGPGWENDVVAFRNYLDARNGMDIFGKVTPHMILDSAGIGEDYHLLQDWGHDILRVGTSLGAGSLALVSGEQLYRVAPEASGTFELVSEGPIRSILRMRYDNWNVDGKTINLIHEISIIAGKWYYQSNVWLENVTGETELATGIATIDLGDKDATMKDVEAKLTYIATHGLQSYNKENLGMAVIINNSSFSGIGRRAAGNADGIDNSVLVKMSTSDSNPVSFRFYACWELSDNNFKDELYFYQFLDKEAEKMANPIQYSFN